MKIERREFLETAVAGTAGVMVAGLPDVVQAGPPKKSKSKATDPTAIVPLGKCLKTTRIGFGTGMAGWMRRTNQTKLGREVFEDLLAYCYDQNVRMFDLADLYGTMPYAGRALKSKPRESFTLVTKIWPHPKGLPETERPEAEACVKRFLKECQTDYLDLVQIHCVQKPDWPKKFRGYMDGLEKCKERGLIRAHGVSVHSLDALKVAAEEPWVDAIHARINPFQHRTDGPMDQVAPVLKKVHKAGKGIIAMKLIGEGKFDAKQRAETLKFAMDLGCVDVMIVGFEKKAEVDDFKKRVTQRLAAMSG